MNKISMCTSVVICTIFIIYPNHYVSAYMAELQPLVIIPGIAGSWNTDTILKNKDSEEKWKFFPGDHTWDKVILELKRVGYELDKNLFIAFYDWRKSNTDSAVNYLIPTINKALDNSLNTKVNIIAHSMGGLVARAYIQSSGYRGDVDKLIMLGTPNLGSADVYVLWAGGDIPRGWSTIHKVIAGRSLDILSILTPGVSNDIEAVRTFIPSIQELLPIYDFLRDSEGNLKDYHNLIDTKNPFLEDLRDSAHALTKLNSLVVIAGTSTPTIKTIPVVDREPSDTDEWIDGKPKPIEPIPNSMEGDNRVMIESALLHRYDIESQQVFRDHLWSRILTGFPTIVHADFDWDNFLKTEEINSSHGSLPTLAIKNVFEALSLDPEPIPNYAPLAEADNIVSFWFASPVTVKIVDPQGRSIARDYNEIPGASYIEESDPNGVKIFLIENGFSGEYGIELIGTGNGDYHIFSSVVSDDIDETTIVRGSIKIGEKHQYTTSINTIEPIPPLISDPIIIKSEEDHQQEDTKELTLQELITLLREKIVSLENIRPNLKNRLLKKADNIERQSKKKKTSIKLLEDIEEGLRKYKKKTRQPDEEEMHEILSVLDRIKDKLK